MHLATIIAQAKRGHKQSEKALFAHIAPVVYKVCWRYTRRKSDTEDLFQECMITIFDQLKKYKQKKGDIKAWSHGVSIRTALAYLRTSKRLPTLVYTDKFPSDLKEDFDIPVMPIMTVLEEVKKMPEGYRLIFDLFVFEGWSHQEIARELNIAESTSRSQLSRARKLLKKRLNRQIEKHYARQNAR